MTELISKLTCHNDISVISDNPEPSFLAPTQGFAGGLVAVVDDGVEVGRPERAFAGPVGQRAEGHHHQVGLLCPLRPASTKVLAVIVHSCV